MMGTEKLNRHFVGTAFVSVLLSLLLALTPVLAVAEPANGGSASADAAEATPSEDDASEAVEDVSDDAGSAASSQSESPVPADATPIAPAESESYAAIETSSEASAQAVTAGADCVMSSDTYENSVTAANMVLLVSFSDTSQDMLNAFNASYAYGTDGIPTNWRYFMWAVDGLNRPGIRSWRDYLYEISQGQCNVKSYFPQGQANGTMVHITLDKPASSYKDNDGLLVGDVVQKFNARFPSYDVSKTDKNGDGFIDNLMIVATSKNVFTAHKASLGGVVVFGSGTGGKVKESITVVEGPLTLSDTGTVTMFGFSESVAVHEYLHTLGARDYYRNGIEGEPVGYWDVMSKGGVFSWPLAFTRESIGWTSIPEVNLKDLADSYTLYAPAQSDAKKGVSNPSKPQALKIKSPLSSSEYFIVEYRQKGSSSSGYDYWIGASGLIVYRVNEKYSDVGNIGGKDYVYVFRPGETGLKDSGGDIGRSTAPLADRAAIAAGSYVSQGDKMLNTSIGSTDLDAQFTDNTIFFENGLNSGIKIDAVSQTDGSITFKISTADYEQADMWEVLTNTDGSAPFGSWDSPTVQATSDESNPYMLVGSTSSASLLWAVWKHDGANWQQVGTKQNDMRNVRIAILNGAPYLLGVSTSNQKQLVLKALVSGVWNTVATTTLNGAIWSTDLRAIGGKLYTFAGANGDCRMFTLEGSTLKQYGPALPVASSYAVSLTDCGGQPLFVANDQSGAKTNAYRFNGSSWSVTKIKDSASSVIDSVVKDGKTYVYAFTYNGVSNDARLSVLSSDAVVERSYVLPELQDATSDTSICAGKNNLYFAKSTSTGVKAYSLPYSAANTGDVSQVTQLGGTVFSSASSMDAVAIGDTAYCMLGDTSSSSIAVRHHKLQTGDTAEPLDPSQGGSTDPTKTSISDAAVSVANQTYTGKALTPKPTVKVGTTTLREGTDYTLSYKNNTNAGTASVTVTGKGNYAGTATRTFTIVQRSISSATVGVATQTYTGKALTPKPTVTLSGYGTLREGTDYTVAYGSNVNVGTGSVTIIGTGNYTGSRKATFRIEPKPGASTGGGSGSSTAPSGVAMHRLYNPNSGEHFYTASAHERDSLRRAGWKYEGVGWTAPASSRTPVHRLYSGTDHHYTTSAAERDMLVRAGWKYEGVGWYSDDAKGVPLYRQFNPNVNPGAPRNNSGSHNYTTSRAEHDHLVSVGWRGEGIGWYGM